MKRMRTTNGYVTLAQIAELTGVNKFTLTRLANKGLMPLAKRKGKHGWYRVSQLELRRKLMPELPPEALAEVSPAGWLTVKGASTRLGVSPFHIYNLVKSGALDGKRVNDLLHVSVASCDRYAEARKIALEARGLRLRLAALERQREALTKRLEKATPTVSTVEEGADATIEAAPIH